MTGRLARWSCLLWLANACTFDPHTGDDGDDSGSGSDSGSGGNTARCRVDDGVRADLRLCLDFQDPFPMSVAHDASGLAHDATALGTVTMQPRVADDVGAQLATSSLHVDETDDLDLSELTVEMFVYIRSAPLREQRYFVLDNSGQYLITIEDNREVRCTLSGDRYVTSGTRSMPARLEQSNHWYHIGCTYDGSELRVYIDGNTTDCESVDGSIEDFSAGTAIGASALILTPPTELLAGGVDNIHIFSRALTGDEMCRAAGKMPGSCRTSCPPDGDH
jgi:concanavalin A-like lectin/glucanase superfamily protein